MIHTTPNAETIPFLLHERIATELSLKPEQVQRTVALLLDDATVPFIARYRKEATGNLDEEQIRRVAERHKYYQELEQRRATILKTLTEQEKLSDVLREQILLMLPMQRVCREDCKGICPICGKNRNESDCHCTATMADDRWSSLKQFKKA